MTAWLTRIGLQGFKNLDAGEGFKPGDLTLLIGPNGCGKSNLIAVLQFLQECFISDREDGGGSRFASAWFNRLGGSMALDASLKKPGNVVFQFDFENREIAYSLRYELIVQAVDGINFRILKETLSILSNIDGNNKLIDYFVCHEQAGVCSILHNENNFSDPAYEAIEVKYNDLGLVSILNNYFVGGDVLYYKPVNWLSDAILQWRFYNANRMDLNTIRSVDGKGGASDIVNFSASFDNLPLVMANLFREDIDFEETINMACKNFLPDTRRVRVVAMGKMYIVEWYMNHASIPFNLSDLSDGTIRMLCWAMLLKSPRVPSLLVIEEPELGIHVAWMPLLAAWIKDASRRTQVMVITHSPDLLDEFTDQPECVHCFNRTPDKRFGVKQLSRDLLRDHLDDAGWKLGELYRIGEPDVGGWPW